MDYELYLQLPTPTPRPPAATPPFDIPIETLPQTLAVEAVQQWNRYPEPTGAIQVVILVIIVFLGIRRIMQQYRTL